MKIELHKITVRDLVAGYINSEEEGGGADAVRIYAYEEMEGDHIVPWSKGGKTEPGNLQMLCRRCNGVKGGR